MVILGVEITILSNVYAQNWELLKNSPEKTTNVCQFAFVSSNDITINLFNI